MRNKMAKMRKFGRWVVHSWIVLGGALLLFLVLEIILSAALLIRSNLDGSAVSSIDHRIGADTYLGGAWLRSYYAELHRSGIVHWVPYVYWRRMPFQGEYITIDTHGLRVTAPLDTGDQKICAKIRIFMFGGSTMWGTGVRDAFTIPSLLSRALDNLGLCNEVINFGESGYVSTQEVIALLLELQKGNIPDLVIFYDGVNDVYSAYQQQIAGLPQNEFKRVAEFNVSNPAELGRLRRMALNESLRQLSTTRVLGGLLKRTGFRTDLQLRATLSPVLGPAGQDESLAHAVRSVYFSNIELVEALGEHYQFKSLFYWQPTTFQKESLTAYELSERDRMGTDLSAFFRITYESIRENTAAEASVPSFRDLSLVFSAVDRPLYVDWSHLGEDGNSLIAEILSRDALSVIRTSDFAAKKSAPADADKPRR